MCCACTVSPLYLCSIPMQCYEKRWLHDSSKPASTKQASWCERLCGREPSLVSIVSVQSVEVYLVDSSLGELDPKWLVDSSWISERSTHTSQDHEQMHVLHSRDGTILQLDAAAHSYRSL